MYNFVVGLLCGMLIVSSFVWMASDAILTFLVKEAKKHEE